VFSRFNNALCGEGVRRLDIGTHSLIILTGFKNRDHKNACTSKKPCWNGWRGEAIDGYTNAADSFSGELYDVQIFRLYSITVVYTSKQGDEGGDERT
jgi:hypothetical protein